MNSHRKILGSFLAACVLTVAAWAAEASPAGHWKWTVQGRQGGQGFDQTLTLNLKDGVLSGVMHGRSAGQFSVPDTPITGAVYKDGVIKFAITREYNGQKFTTKYEGKLEGDIIKGTFERDASAKGGPTKSEWNAQRQKNDKQ